VSVVRLTDRLKAAEVLLVRGMAGLEGAAVPEAASAALADALRDLRLGVAESQALAAEVQAAEAEDAAEEAASRGWLGALLLESSTQNAAFDAEMSALREELTSRITGSSTFVLDAEGRVTSHVDALDFDAALAGAPLTAQLEGQSKDAQLGSAAEERAMRVSAAQADAIFQFCVAHRLPSNGSWTWRFDVVRQLMWEAFLRDEDMDDEARPAARARISGCGSVRTARADTMVSGRFCSCLPARVSPRAPRRCASRSRATTLTSWSTPSSPAARSLRSPPPRTSPTGSCSSRPTYLRSCRSCPRARARARQLGHRC
jgi:hypothetical protein